jgi:hypothetical protein
VKFECPGRDDFEETQPGEGHLHWLRQATCNGPLLGYFNGLFVAYEMCINHSDYISIAGEILISFPGNSLEPLVVFEQVYWTCLRMTDPFQSDMGCRYPLKLFNITLTANPSHPFRQVHAPVVQTEVPKEAEAKNNPGFFLKFHYATRSRSFEKLR